MIVIDKSLMVCTERERERERENPVGCFSLKPVLLLVESDIVKLYGESCTTPQACAKIHESDD